MPERPQWLISCFVLGLTLTLSPLTAVAEMPPLIPRQVLFDNPERSTPRLSPDGRHLSWLAPDRNGVMQVWAQTVRRPDAKALTSDPKRGVRRHAWAADTRTLLYFQDTDGDENWHLYGIDLPTGLIRDYTPFPNVQADLIGTHPSHPDDALVSLNRRDPLRPDVYRLKLSTGALILDTANPGDINQFFADAALQVRAALVHLPDGGKEVRVRTTVHAPWRSLVRVGLSDTLDVIDFTAGGRGLIMRSSVGSDTARIVTQPITGGAAKTISAPSTIDAGDVLLHPVTHAVQAVVFEPDRRQWATLDARLKSRFAAIAKLSVGDVTAIQRDEHDTTWLVSFTDHRTSTQHFLWDCKREKGELLFTEQPKLSAWTLAAMKPVSYTSRDGLSVRGYLTVPNGVEAKHLPLVLYVHGGPWMRDSWNYVPDVQFLANRGYACLQVNFRGSTGYGKRFLSAGNRQWGLTMQNDLLDAVNWAVKQGVADPKRVAIFGYSYGGYATLAGLAFSPEVFTCGVDVFGPSNLLTLLASTPPQWHTMRSMLSARVGNVDAPQDQAMLRDASPLFKADRITRPLLIGQGANDVRVKPAESEQIVSAIEKNGGAVTYVLYPDEGHAQFRPANDMDFWARIEGFLARHLGGRFEPLAGEVYPGSTAIVRHSPKTKP